MNYTTYSRITSAALHIMQPSNSCNIYPFFHKTVSYFKYRTIQTSAT